MNPPFQSGLAPVQVNRVRVIQRSIRCFVLGAVGVFPVLGLATGYLALRVQREIAAEVGETWDFKPLHFYWALTMFMMSFFVYFFWPMTALLGMVALIGHFAMVKRVADRARSDEWNPARHLVYWGVAFAYVGRALTLTAVFVIVAAISRNLMR